MAMGRKQGCASLSWVVVLGLAGALNASANVEAQQIVPDTSLPVNSAVTVNGNNFTINGGTQAGGNLFHSFSEFSIPTNGSAFFNNAQTIQNIISRVTGSSVSSIDGILGANNTANLFLLNPNGIVFGPNASLNVGGSFVATTANAIQFGNQGFFSASNPNNPALLTVNPDALFFNQIAALNPNISTTATNLSVRDGRGLFLVGGNINIDRGRLNAFGGRVELGGLAEVGTVGLNLIGNDLSLSFPDAVKRGNVSLSNGAIVDVSAGNGGNIAINARSLQLIAESGLVAGIIRTGLGSAESQAGNIEVNAQDAVSLDQSFIYNDVFSNATGQGGSVNITTGTLALSNGAQISTSTFGQGNAGSITINARDRVSFDSESILFSTVEPGAVGNGGSININSTSGSLSFDNSGALSTVEPGAVGNGGDINIMAGSVSLSNGAGLIANTFGQGNAGVISVQALGNISLQDRGTAISSNIQPEAVGNAGNININSTAGSVSLSNGAQLNVNTSGQGNAGVISVQALGNISLQDRGTVISSSIQSEAVGNGGSININSTAGSVSLSNGAELFANNSGQGNAGNIYIKADQLSLTENAAFVGDLSGQGRGADINLDITGKISLIGGETVPTGESTRITLGVQPGGRGDGGNLNIKAGSLELRDGAIVKDSTQGNGNAGNVDIKADVVDISGSVPASGLPSGLFTSTDTAGKAGDITITTGRFQIADGAALSARTRGNGQGGNITVNTSSFEAINGGQLVTTTFGQGQAGNIFVNAKEQVNISGSDPNYSTRIRRFPTPIDPLVANDIRETGAASGLFASVESGSTGQGGSVNIKAGTLSLSNGAQLNVNTSGQGNAGVISVQALGNISLQDPGTAISSNIQPGAVGDGGSININSTAGSVSLSNGAELFANNSGQGNAGNIYIKADQLSLTENAAFVGDLSGQGRGADINLEITGKISLIGGQTAPTGESTRITLGVQPGGRGEGGNLRIQAGSLELRDGAIVKDSTQGNGNAGNVDITADVVDISGSVLESGLPSGLFTSTDTAGKAGDITVNSRIFQIADGAALSARTRGQGQGGNITVNSTSFSATNGGQLVTTTSTQAQAGNIFVNAKEQVNISGSDPNYSTRIGKFPNPISRLVANDITETEAASGLFASTVGSSTGQGGNLTINTRSLRVQDRAMVTVSSPQGQAGNLNITANTIRLNQGSLTAKTSITRDLQGANINLQGLDLLLLQNGSRISAQANGTANGGNITIDAPEGFVVAPLGQDNDIIASASLGRGGNITINTQGIFNFFKGRAIPGNTTNDIDASSEFNNAGTVTINTPDVDPSQGLVTLPIGVVNVPNPSASGCTAFIGKEGNSFTVTGRGGLPPSPDDFLSGDVVWSDTRNLASASSVSNFTLYRRGLRASTSAAKVPPKTTERIAIVPATGWVFNGKGEVTLISNVSTTERFGSDDDTCLRP
jgi:filamentous hemagglutinin family protein